MIALRAATRTMPRMMMAATARPAAFAIGRRFISNEINKSAVPFKYSPDVKVLYSEDHEWLAVHGDGTAFVGITKYAADALGDATFCEVPEEGAEIEKGDSLGSVESVKSASELYSPVNCEVLEGNSELEDKPSLVNEDPLGAGWFGKIKVSDASEIEELMNLEAYEEFIKSD